MTKVMERETGLEPATSSLEGYAPSKRKIVPIKDRHNASMAVLNGYFFTQFFRKEVLKMMKTFVIGSIKGGVMTIKTSKFGPAFYLIKKENREVGLSANLLKGQK